MHTHTYTIAPKHPSPEEPHLRKRYSLRELACTAGSAGGLASRLTAEVVEGAGVCVPLLVPAAPGAVMGVIVRMGISGSQGSPDWALCTRFACCWGCEVEGLRVGAPRVEGWLGRSITWMYLKLHVLLCVRQCVFVVEKLGI